MGDGTVLAGRRDVVCSTAIDGGCNVVGVACVQVWNPLNNVKFETLSYMPPLTSDQIAKQIDYMTSNGYIPCLEFDPVSMRP